MDYCSWECTVLVYCFVPRRCHRWKGAGDVYGSSLFRGVVPVYSGLLFRFSSSATVLGLLWIRFWFAVPVYLGTVSDDFHRIVLKCFM